MRAVLVIAACLWASAAWAAGAIPTYTTVKPAGVFDVVTDGGADPTGAVNSSPAFQAGASSGRPVWVPLGTYDFLTPVIFPSSSSILCQGVSPTTAGATLKVNAANIGAGGGVIFQTANATNVIFDGCVYDGNKPLFSIVATRLILINGGDQVVIRNSTFQNTTSLAIAMFNSPNPINNSGIDNSIFNNVGLATDELNFDNDGNTTAISFPGVGRGTNNYLTSSTFSNIGDNGITLQNQSFFTAHNNYFNLNLKQWRLGTGAGQGIGFGPTAIWFTSTAGQLSDHGVFTDNVIRGVTGNCMDLTGNFIIVMRNYIDTCGGAGVAIGNNVLVSLDSTNEIVSNVISNSGISWRSSDFRRQNIVNTGGVSFSCGLAPCPNPGLTTNTIVRDNAFLNNGWDVYVKKDKLMALGDNMQILMDTNGPVSIIRAR